jgi:hypothetical protein
MLTLPLTVSDERYRAVIGSIRNVRVASRQVFACLFSAQAAGAEIGWNDENLRVTPKNDRAKAIMEAVFDKGGKAPIYSARQYVLDHLLPTCRSFVWDELRANVWSRWTARDAEFPTASRGYLALNGVRRLAIFAGTGIGFPRLTARPVLADHALTLHWDRELGPVEFGVGTLDPGRWHTWKRIVEGVCPHGTITLNELNGKLVAYVPYEVAACPVAVDPERILTVKLAEDGESLTIAGPDGKKTFDSISLAEAADWLLRLSAQRAAWERRRGACGSPRKPWGERKRFRAVGEHLNRVTLCREHGRRHRNHAWSKRIVTRASDWCCGVIRVEIETEELHGQPWSWPELASCCRYKSAVLGITTV